jgi:hypothetical protein
MTMVYANLQPPDGTAPAVTRRLVVSYTTFSPLPPSTFRGRPPRVSDSGGYFLLPTPAVTNSFHFQKWSALCCPDFPLAPPSDASDRPGHCLTTRKINKNIYQTTIIACFFRPARMKKSPEGYWICMSPFRAVSICIMHYALCITCSSSGRGWWRWL